MSEAGRPGDGWAAAARRSICAYVERVFPAPRVRHVVVVGVAGMILGLLAGLALWLGAAVQPVWVGVVVSVLLGGLMGGASAAVPMSIHMIAGADRDKASPSHPGVSIRDVRQLQLHPERAASVAATDPAVVRAAVDGLRAQQRQAPASIISVAIGTVVGGSYFGFWFLTQDDWPMGVRVVGMLLVPSVGIVSFILGARSLGRAASRLALLESRRPVPAPHIPTERRAGDEGKDQQ